MFSGYSGPSILGLCDGYKLLYQCSRSSCGTLVNSTAVTARKPMLVQRHVALLKSQACVKWLSGKWRSERGVWGSTPPPPHCEKMCIFYCLVFEQKQWLSLYFFNSVRNSLSDDVNGHSWIKETRVCDCVTINYRDAAYIYGLPCIVYKLYGDLLPIRFAACKL